MTIDNISSAELRRLAEEKLAQQAPAPPVSEIDTQRLLHELQVHQIELELQNSALRRAVETAQKLALAVEQTPLSIVITDLAASIEYANLAFSVISGYSNDEVLGKNPRFQQSGQTPHTTYEQLWQTLTSGQIWRGELINRRKNGEIYKEFQVIAPVRRNNGEVTHYVCVKEDVTEKRQAEQARLESEKRFQDIAEASADWIWEINPEGCYTFVSDGVKALLGYSKEEVLGKTPLDFMPPEEAERIGAIFAASAARRESFRSLDSIVLRKDGGRRYVQTDGVPILNADGQYLGYRGLDRDVTERKRIEHFEHVRSHTLELLAGDAPLPDVLEALVRGVEQFNPSMLCSILLLDAEGCHLVEGAAPSLPDFYNKAINGVKIGMGVGSCGTAAFIGQRVIVEDVQTHPYWAAFKELAAQAKLGACWSEPIRSSSGQVLGTFAIYHHEALTPSDLDLSVIEQTAHLASIAIERKNAENEIRRLNADLEVRVRQRTADLEIANQSLTTAKEDADAANRAKSTFLANMSHELRTPMNAVMGLTNIALRQTEDPRLRDLLGKVDRASHHLLAVINDILDISKIEAERMTLEKNNFILGEVLENLISVIGHNVSDKGLTLSIDVPPDIGRLTLRGDALRLSQILLNLTANAVKFTEAGTITLRVLQVEKSLVGVLLRFEVQDTGIGISAEDKERLFTAFEQADGSMTRKYGGTGLGLAISKRLAHLMGGEIGVQSQLGSGSTFWFTARIETANEIVAPAQAKNAKSAEERMRTEHANAHILLAEDEPINQEVARGVLEDVGLVVDLAEDGNEAVALAKQNRYALILMDMQMPNLNGVDATRAIRSLPGYAEIPILAMTANAFDEDRQVCIDAGMNAHIGKPVDPNKLFETLLKWLSKSRG